MKTLPQVVLTQGEFVKLKRLAIVGLKNEYQLTVWSRKPKTIADLNEALNKLRRIGKRKNKVFERLQELAIEALEYQRGTALGENAEETRELQQEAQDEIDWIRKLKRL